MRDAFLDFEWPVAPTYEWQDWLDDDGQPVTVSASRWSRLESPSAAIAPGVERIWGRLDAARKRLAAEAGPVLNAVHAENSLRYSPLRQHSALFQEFAKLDYRDRAAILEFAGEHGVLGLPARHQTVPIRSRSGRVSWYSAYGESHFDWAREICYMREALRLSDHEGSVDRLRRLKWLCDRHLHDLAGRLSFNSAKEPRLAIEPVSLIAAMWLQLTLAFTGGKQFPACKNCGHVFEISTDLTGSRSDREFCSISCKTKDYRKRKRTALHMAEGGTPLVDIASKINTSEVTIERWLAASRSSAHGRT